VVNRSALSGNNATALLDAKKIGSQRNQTAFLCYDDIR
jgi:hypothetical protein